ncbi:acyltransferase domain-containing protein [Streptomyces sp. DHE17-7]|nr:acyltransferase domain-containing protein [Streptomyces sp. DHE17-7]
MPCSFATLTGRPASARTSHAAYWVRHARSTVRFADAVRAAHEAGAATFLEIGPGGSLCAAAQDTLGDDSDADAVPLLRTGRPEDESALTALARPASGTSCGGASPVDWAAVHAGPAHTSTRHVTPSSTRRTGRTPPRPPPAAAPPEPPTRPTPHCGPPSSPATPPGWPGCSACATRSTPPSTRCCRPCRPGGAPARSVPSWTPPATGSPGTPPAPGAPPSSTDWLASHTALRPTGTPLPASQRRRGARSSTACAVHGAVRRASSADRDHPPEAAPPCDLRAAVETAAADGGTGVSGVLSLLPLGDPAHPEDGLPTGFALGVS